MEETKVSNTTEDEATAFEAFLYEAAEKLVDGDEELTEIMKTLFGNKRG